MGIILLGVGLFMWGITSLIAAPIPHIVYALWAMVAGILLVMGK